jgi:hypothetical protein
MASTQQNPTETTLPLTIEHGRKIFDQGKAIAADIQTLKPLLELLNEAVPPTNDPILRIVELLETMLETQIRQDNDIALANEKLDIILASAAFGWPPNGSAV